MTVLDVGANVGYYSLIAAGKVGAEGRVYAFEPEPKNFQILLRNIQENGYVNVVPLQKAISSSVGRETLFFDDMNLACPSLSGQNVTRDSGGVEVETTTLDSFVTAEGVVANFLKIDIQGAEGFLVRGAHSTLLSQHPTILMEFWPFGLQSFSVSAASLWKEFEQYGYRMSVLNELDERIEDVPIDEVLSRCEARAGGRGHVNLLLR